MGERHHVSSITFSGDGVEFTFMELPGDVRQDGGLIRTRSYAVRWDNLSYSDQLEELRALATTLVEDVDEDFEDAEVYVPTGEDEVDEIEGMGSG